MRAILAIQLASAMLLGLATPASAIDIHRDCNGGPDIDKAIRACSAVIGRGRREPIRNQGLAFFYRALQYQRKGSRDFAIRDYTAALQVDPQKQEAYNNRGAIYLDKGDLDRAVADFDQALRLNPSDRSATINRGEAYYKKGDPDRAIADFDQALRRDPNDRLAMTKRAFASYKKGDYARAVMDFDAAVRLDPKDSGALINRGTSCYRVGDLDHAIADCTLGAFLDGKVVEARDVCGRAFFKQAKFRDAVTALQAAIAIDPNYKDDVEGTTSADVLALAQRRLAEGSATAEAARQGGAAADRAGAAIARIVPAETRIALVIGNSRYASVEALNNPEHDAAIVAAALRQDGFTAVTVAFDLSHDALLKALRTFAAQADQADWAVVYYAGHGIEVGGVNYLVPVDAKLASDRDVPDESVPLERVLTAVEGARKLRLIVLDACRNNPFIATMKQSGASRGIRRGLAQVEPDQATLVAYSAKDGSVAQDGEGANSPFATALAKRLAEPDVEINKVFRLVRQDVMEVTGRQQEPFVYGSLPPTDFYFVSSK